MENLNVFRLSFFILDLVLIITVGPNIRFSRLSGRIPAIFNISPVIETIRISGRFLMPEIRPNPTYYVFSKKAFIIYCKIFVLYCDTLTKHYIHITYLLILTTYDNIWIWRKTVWPLNFRFHHFKIQVFRFFLDSKFDILPIENTHHKNFIIKNYFFFTGRKVGGNGLFLRWYIKLLRYLN